jgi:hypothetical protein
MLMIGTVRAPILSELRQHLRRHARVTFLAFDALASCPSLAQTMIDREPSTERPVVTLCLFAATPHRSG